MINLLYTYSTNGPGKVIENLKLGLRSIGVDFIENPKSLKEEDKVIALQWHDLIKTANPKNLLVGPNVCTLPFDNDFVMSQNYNKLITPSEWVSNLYSKWIPKEKIFSWPVGINTNLFSDKSKHDKEFDCLIYFKRRDVIDLQIITKLLKKHNQTFQIIEYGNYTENQFIELISKSKYGIVLDNCESQGIAIQEMMSCSLPLFVWDVTKWSDRGDDFSCDASSIPYWSEGCGVVFYKQEEIEDKFVFFIKNIDFFKPRDYILENLSLEKQSGEIIKIL